MQDFRKLWNIYPIYVEDDDDDPLLAVIHKLEADERLREYERRQKAKESLKEAERLVN